ncbi:MAG: transcriptional repressor [Candidatus Moraniibacteriota bacterium]|nr:MAG: transcriptional repressor [Candidatus Moranbacteria bacterium]
MTKVRKALLSLFEVQDKPFSAEEVAQYLKSLNIVFDLTTVYRQLQSFKEEGFLEYCDIPGQTRFYEVKNQHHHHFVCEQCEEKECFEEDFMKEALQKAIFFLESCGLKVRSHSFSFSGLCKKCQMYKK